MVADATSGASAHAFGAHAFGAHAFGALGEQAACAYLQQRNYRILERNARTAGGEIDLIVEDASTTLVFVEVKSRRQTGGVEEALLAVSAAKQQRLIRAATAYLQGCDHPGPYRFDVVAVGVCLEGTPCVVAHIQDAFVVDR